MKYNREEQRSNPISKHRPLTYPYTYWVDEDGKGTDYHCAYCGQKIHYQLEECPCCKADVLTVKYTDIIRYTTEL